jgi:hypothetical protein
VKQDAAGGAGPSRRSAECAHKALQAFGRAGVGYAFLHGETEVAVGTVRGDLDLVVSEPALQCLRRARHHLADEGLCILSAWANDVGGTGAVCIADRRGEAGVQLDLLYDPRGAGKFGIRTTRAMKRTVKGERWPTLPDIERLLYVARKGQLKGDRMRTARTLTALREHDPAQVDQVLQWLFSFRPRLELRRLLAGRGPLPGGRRLSHLRSLWRYADRMRAPAGHWVEVYGDGSAAIGSSLADRLEPLMIGVARGPRPGHNAAFLWWWVMSVLPTRVRAGAYVSWAGVSAGKRADVVLEVAEVDELVAASVDAFERRTLGRLGIPV